MRQSIKGMQPFQILASNFSIGPSNEGYTLQISADGNNYSDLFSVGANVTRMVTGVANGSYYRLNGNNSEVVINWQTQCNDGGGSGSGGTYVLPIASDVTLGGIKVGSGLSIDNNGVLSSEGGEDIALVHLDSLSGTGSANTVYECDDKLWYWEDNGGVVAEWSDNLATIGPERGYGLIFSYIPVGQTIFEFRSSTGGDWRSIKMSGDTVVLCESDGTVISACTVGNTAQFGASQYPSNKWVNVYNTKHYIGFYPSASLSFQNIWDGTVNGGHWGIVDHSNYPFVSLSSDSGIPRWNSKGQIIKYETSVGTKNMYFNATGTSMNNRLTVLTNGTGNGPDHIFGPTDGGTSGQILQSNGNAAPVWTNWIKSVKITSAAYEALVQAGTTDPNTLYLIDDNV